MSSLYLSENNKINKVINFYDKLLIKMADDIGQWKLNIREAPIWINPIIHHILMDKYNFLASIKMSIYTIMLEKILRCLYCFS